MDNDFPIDVGEILGVVRSAEVIVLRFLIIAERLLVDPRYDEREGPLIKLVAPASSAEERFRSLKQLRPSFKLPERITVIHWPKFVDRLEESGVWAGIEQRVLAAGFPQSAAVATETLSELRRMERDQVRRAILGDDYQTLWEAV